MKFPIFSLEDRARFQVQIICTIIVRTCGLSLAIYFAERSGVIHLSYAIHFAERSGVMHLSYAIHFAERSGVMHFSPTVSATKNIKQIYTFPAGFKHDYFNDRNWY